MEPGVAEQSHGEAESVYIAPPYVPGVTAIKPPYKGKVHMARPTPRMATKEQKENEEVDRRAKTIPPKTRSYKFKYMGQQFRFLKKSLEIEAGGIKVDRHASNLEAIAKVESKGDAEFRVMERHRRQVDLLIAELSKIEEVVEEYDSMLPSEVLKMVTAKKKKKHDLHSERRKKWWQRKKEKQRNGRLNQIKDDESGAVTSSTRHAPQAHSVPGDQHQLSQVLEAPSLLESSSSVVEHGSVIKPSAMDHDSFHDLRFIGDEEGPEEDEEEEQGEGGQEWHEAERRARRQKLNARHSGIGTSLALQAFEDKASLPAQLHPQKGHSHIKFSTKRHWYVDGPAVYFNLDSMNERQQHDHQHGVSTQAANSSLIRRAKHSGKDRQIRSTHVSSAANKWSLSARQRHLAASVDQMDQESDSSEYSSSSDDDMEDSALDSPTNIALASLMADKDDTASESLDEEFPAPKSASRPESENSVNNQESRERSQAFLSAVPQLDAEALQDLKVSLRNVHMYYRNYNRSLEANTAPGVEEEITRSPREWDWFESKSGSNSRPSTTNAGSRGTSRGQSRSCSRGQSRESSSRDKARDDSALDTAPSESKLCHDAQQPQSKSVPVTAREGYDGAAAEEGGEEDASHDQNTVADSSQRDVALALTRLRQAKGSSSSPLDRTGPVIANSNFFLQRQEAAHGEKNQDEDSSVDCSWMVRSAKDAPHGEKKVLTVPHRPDSGPPSRSGTGATSRATSSSGARPGRRNIKPVTPEIEHRHPAPESPVRRVRTPQLLKEVIDEEARHQQSVRQSAAKAPLRRGVAVVTSRGQQLVGPPRASQVPSYRMLQRAGNTRSKAFVAHAEEIHAELKNLPIFEDFALYSLNKGQRAPLMSSKGTSANDD